MKVDLSVTQVLEAMAKAARAHLIIEGDQAKFQLRLLKGRSCAPLLISHLQNVLEELEQLNVQHEVILLSKARFEGLVKEETRLSRLSRGQDEPLELEDHDNECRYNIASVSDAYTLFYLLKLHTEEAFFYLGAALSRRLEEGEDVSIFQVLSRYVFRISTLQIHSSKDRTLDDFQTLADSLMFQISYNLGAALVMQREAMGEIEPRRSPNFRRMTFNVMNPPKKKYIRDLVYHYQMGVAAESPYIEFISFYHILEHFFEAVYMDELVETVRIKITSPDFTYKRKKDLQSLIKLVTKSVQARNDSVTFSEQSALELTLRKYVKLESLRALLAAYDAKLLPYYAQAKVDFANAPTVDFSGPDEQIYKSIAGRIYATRNALIHSKESERARFTPFKDDRYLLKEIPLIRLISEEVVIATSSPM